MKHLLSVLSFALVIVFFSCKEKTDKEPSGEQPSLNEKTKNSNANSTIGIQNPKVDINSLESDFITWWSYQLRSISLASNFIGFNEKSKPMGKKEFLEKLTTGNFIPLRYALDETIQYKLHKLSASSHKSISVTIKNEALTGLKYFRMEGLRFPDFDFIDLNGDRFSTESTAGQLKIIKTWFINCVACVKEFPELNTFVEKNSNKKDVICLSLATDVKPELDSFLKKKPFSYKVVSNQNTFIVEKLKLQIYPTHIVVDKNGKILKVVNKASEMISFFEDYNESEAKVAPIPPSI